MRSKVHLRSRGGGEGRGGEGRGGTFFYLSPCFYHHSTRFTLERRTTQPKTHKFTQKFKGFRPEPRQKTLTFRTFPLADSKFPLANSTFPFCMNALRAFMQKLSCKNYQKLFMQKLSLERVRTVLVARLGVFPVTLWRDATRACSNAFACHRLGIHASEHVSVLNTRDTEFKGRKRSKNTSKKKLFIL